MVTCCRAVLLLLAGAVRCTIALTIHSGQSLRKANYSHQNGHSAASPVREQKIQKQGFKATAGQFLGWQASNSQKHPPSKSHSSVPIAFAQQPFDSWPVLVHQNQDDDIVVRPKSGRGVDEVTFSLIAKNFYGTELADNRFTIDIVLSLTWIDNRVIDLIPADLDQLTMAWSQALERIWMPGIVVANRDIERYEIISASVTIFRSGEVLRVERAQARCMKKYQLQEYPFDTQEIYVELVSSKYMLDEVVLIADKGGSGVLENIWGLYTLKGWDTKVVEDQDGSLHKSRGYLLMTLERSIKKYIDDHLVPCGIMLTISCAVFYFPFGTNPFITPRLVLSILALLTFTNLMIKSNALLPGNAAFNWNDLFNQQIQILMFITIVLNLATEICFHSFEQEGDARAMNNEAKILLPGSAVLNIFIILSAGKYKWMGIDEARFVTKIFLVILICGYTFWVGYTLRKKHNIGLVAGLAMLGFASDEATADGGEGGDDGGDGDGDGGDGGDDGGDAGDCGDM